MFISILILAAIALAVGLYLVVGNYGRRAPGAYNRARGEGL